MPLLSGFCGYSMSERPSQSGQESWKGDGAEVDGSFEKHRSAWLDTERSGVVMSIATPDWVLVSELQDERHDGSSLIVVIWNY